MPLHTFSHEGNELSLILKEQMFQHFLYTLNLFEFMINFPRDIEKEEETEMLLRSIALIQW